MRRNPLSSLASDRKILRKIKYLSKSDLKHLVSNIPRNIPTSSNISTNKLLNAPHKDVYEQKIKKVISDIHQPDHEKYLKKTNYDKINKYRKDILSEIRGYPYQRQ